MKITYNPTELKAALTVVAPAISKRSIGKYRHNVIGVSGLPITEPISDVRLWKKAEMPVMSNPKYCDPNYFKPGWLYEK